VLANTKGLRLRATDAQGESVTVYAWEMPDRTLVELIRESLGRPRP
jgi:hypothetical protein